MPGLQTPFPQVRLWVLLPVLCVQHCDSHSYVKGAFTLTKGTKGTKGMQVTRQWEVDCTAHGVVAAEPTKAHGERAARGHWHSVHAEPRVSWRRREFPKDRVGYPVGTLVNAVGTLLRFLQQVRRDWDPCEACGSPPSQAHYDDCAQAAAEMVLMDYGGLCECRCGLACSTCMTQVVADEERGAAIRCNCQGSRDCECPDRDPELGPLNKTVDESEQAGKG